MTIRARWHLEQRRRQLRHRPHRSPELAAHTHLPDSTIYLARAVVEAADRDGRDLADDRIRPAAARPMSDELAG